MLMNQTRSFRGGRLSFVVVIAAIAFFAAVVPAGAVVREQMVQAFDHFSPSGTFETSFEHRIDIPGEWATNNMVFVSRVLRLSGKLHVEREELTGTYYYIKVGLPRALNAPASGSITIMLEAAAEAPFLPVLDPCDRMTVGGSPAKPAFSWRGHGEYTAISLFDKSWNKTVWERVVQGATTAVKIDGNMMVGHHYIWALKQTDETARYSPEAQAAFAIGTRPERCAKCAGQGKTLCPTCRGTGSVTGPNGPQICLPCNGRGHIKCTACNGHGTIQAPIIVEEPLPAPANGTTPGH